MSVHPYISWLSNHLQIQPSTRTPTVIKSVSASSPFTTSPGSACAAVTKSRNKVTAMSLDIRNFGCADKERCMFPTDFHDFYWQQLSDKSGKLMAEHQKLLRVVLEPLRQSVGGRSKLERFKHDTTSTLFTNVAVWSLYHMVDSNSWTGSRRTLCKHYETLSGKGCPVNFSSVDGVLITYFMKTLTTGLQVRENKPFISRGGSLNFSACLPHSPNLNPQI